MEKGLLILNMRLKTLLSREKFYKDIPDVDKFVYYLVGLILDSLSEDPHETTYNISKLTVEQFVNDDVINDGYFIVTMNLMLSMIGSSIWIDLYLSEEINYTGSYRKYLTTDNYLLIYT